MTKREIIIILICSNLIFALAVVERHVKVKEYKESYEYFIEAKQTYDTRIEEMNELINEIEDGLGKFDTVATNLALNERFLSTASPQEILDHYQSNKPSLGGN